MTERSEPGDGTDIDTLLAWIKSETNRIGNGSVGAVICNMVRHGSNRLDETTMEYQSNKWKALFHADVIKMNEWAEDSHRSRERATRELRFKRKVCECGRNL